jgi:hypothetical protein
MNKFIVLTIIIGLLYSCSNNDEKQDWLRNYQEVKCLWVKTENDFGKDTLQETHKLYEQYKLINNKMEVIQMPFSSKMKALITKIEVVNQKYQDEYRRITDAHDLIHGHKSTPEFEKRINNLTANQSEELASLQTQMTTIENELEKNKVYKDLKQESKSLTEEILKTKTNIKARYKLTFGDLQRKLDNQNKQFKKISFTLKAPEKQAFIASRDSIRTNPCQELGF